MPGKLKIFLDIFWVLYQAPFDVEKTAHDEKRLFKRPQPALWLKLGNQQFSETGTWTYAPPLQNPVTPYSSRVPDEATVCVHVHVVASHKTHQQLVAWQENYSIFNVWRENDSASSRWGVNGVLGWTVLGCVSSSHLVLLPSTFI